MKLELLDNFGSEIKWKLLQKDKFQSPFGGLITLMIFLLFFLKIYYFIDKVKEFGFAKNKSIYLRLDEEKNITDFINLRDFSIYCNFMSLEFKIEDYNYKNKINKNSSISEYINFILKWGINNFRTNITLSADRKSFSDEDMEPISYYNFNLKNKNAEKNKTDILIPLKLPTINYAQKMDYHDLFRIEFEFTDDLVKILSTTTNDDQIFYNCYYDYFRLDQKDFKFKRLTNVFYKKFSYNVSHFQPIHMRKIQVEKKIDFDIKDILYDKDDSYEIDPMQMYSFETKGGERKVDYFNGTKISDRYVYAHSFQFSFDVHKIYNEVTLLSIDDFLSVMGGFLQLILFLAEFFVGMYNEHLTNRILNSFCFDKINQYDEKMRNLKIKILKRSNNFLIGIEEFKSPGVDEQNEIKIVDSKLKNIKTVNGVSDSINRNDKPKFMKNLKKHSEVQNKNFNNYDNNENIYSIYNNSTKKELSKQPSIDEIIKLNKEEEMEKKPNNPKPFDDQTERKNILVIRGERMSKDRSVTQKTNIVKNKNDLITNTAREKKTNESSFSKIELKTFEESNKSARKLFEKSDLMELKDKITKDEEIVKKHLTKNKFGQTFLSKVLYNYDKKRRKFNDFDYFDYISIDIYLNLLSGFEALKFFLYDANNKACFDTFSDSYLYSRNCDLLKKNKENAKENIKEINITNLINKESEKEKDYFQSLIFKRFEMLFVDYK